MSKPKYFLYARKSTEEDDKQVMSIEAQLFDLREFARKENLEILEEFQESKSAKTPGRPIFGEMMTRIEAGEAQGIIGWHPFMQTTLIHTPHMTTIAAINTRPFLSVLSIDVELLRYASTSFNTLNMRLHTCRLRQRMAQSFVLPSFSFLL